MNTPVIAKLAGTAHTFKLSKRATLHVGFGDELAVSISPDGIEPKPGEARQASDILDAIAALLRGDEPTRGRPALVLRPSGRLTFNWACR